MSYERIAKALDVPASRILFGTDVYGEAIAAREAGLEVILLLRPGNAPLPADHDFPTATSFDQIQI